MTEPSNYRLEGLESDNLLAFLAVLGVMRALETDDASRGTTDRLNARLAWDVERPPLRPRLFIEYGLSEDALTERILSGLSLLSEACQFDKRKDLNYSCEEARSLLTQQAIQARQNDRVYIDLLAALMSDGAIKDDKERSVDPTPLCLMFGQGHQHFLDRLAKVPCQVAPPSRGRGKNVVDVSAAQCLAEALFHPWHRDDPTFSFRWDPEEDVRYALMAGDPTDNAYKSGTQHGANRLAAAGLAVLTVVPQVRAGRVRPSVIGGIYDAKGFSFAWPVWRDPATLPAVQAMLAHPRLREPGGLVHLGVDHVLVARRISVGKFMNFSRARPVMPA